MGTPKENVEHNAHIRQNEKIFLIKHNDPKVRVQLVTDPTHILYDERVKEKPSDAFVQTVVDFGIQYPVKLTKGPKDGEVQTFLVVDGRKRFQGWEMANAILKKEKRDLIPLPVEFAEGEDVRLAEQMVLLNEQRTPDNPINKAQKAKNILGRSGDMARAAMVFNLPQSGVKMLISLLDLDPKVQDLIRSGELSATAGAQLRQLPKDEQFKTAKEILAEQAKAAKVHGGRKLSVSKVKAHVRAKKANKKSGKKTHSAASTGKKDLKGILKYLEKQAEEPKLSPQRSGWLTGAADAIRFVITGKDPHKEFVVPVVMKKEEEEKAKTKAA
jgi:hypothetical protein